MAIVLMSNLQMKLIGKDIMTNSIEFEMVKAEGENSSIRYVCYICVNGETTGLSGWGDTPDKAKEDARKKLKKLGKRGIN